LYSFTCVNCNIFSCNGVRLFTCTWNSTKTNLKNYCGQIFRNIIYLYSNIWLLPHCVALITNLLKSI
jgi:hypothetical protein